MDIAPTQPFRCLLTVDSGCKSAPETNADRSMKFAEEATFFVGFFKDFSVRPMPDQPLMLVLYKSKLKNKKRKVAKKKKINELYMRKNRDESEDYSDQNSSL